ncbi:MAG TPA: hypothetical protein VF618_01830 [Thermoanaerobaculia bacterium]
MRPLVVLAALLSIVACSDAERTTAAAPEPPATATQATATIAQTPSPAPAPADTAAAAAAHDVTGSYFAMTPLPKDFAELDHLMLATIDENGEPAPLNGFLRPKGASAQDYALVSPSIQGNALQFTTVAVKDVHYTFTGTFARLDHFPQNPPDYETPILTGTLTKLRGNQQIAQTPVQFRYEAGG